MFPGGAVPGRMRESHPESLPVPSSRGLKAGNPPGVKVSFCFPRGTPKSNPGSAVLAAGNDVWVKASGRLSLCGRSVWL